MTMICFCGWSGEIEDQRPLYLGDGAWGLACPQCERPDDLSWLPAEAAWPTLAEAAWRQQERERQLTSADQPRDQRPGYQAAA